MRVDPQHLPANDGEKRWLWQCWSLRMSAERAALASARAHGSIHGNLKSFGTKRIDMGKLVVILLKLSIIVLDENRC
jgi:hypothetical protein